MNPPAPTPNDAQTILEHLETVERERAARRGDPALQVRVDAIKRYQRERFAATYADLQESPRYQGAARFFLDELYGPEDYSQRDAQFARVVPALARLFPKDVLRTVRTLAELHALAEELDTGMARQLGAAKTVSAATYTKAWVATGQPATRERQIVLITELGAALDEYTRKPMLRHALRMMRAPAAAAGLSKLQQFLETGFDTFKAMRGSQEFMRLIGERERALAAALFAGDASGLVPQATKP